jgi:hypothetical protein
VGRIVSSTIQLVRYREMAGSVYGQVGGLEAVRPTLLIGQVKDLLRKELRKIKATLLS